MVLDDREKALLNRITGQKRLYLAFSVMSVLIAASLMVYYGLVARDISSARLIIIILVLLAGRANLRQYKSAVIMQKLKLHLERKDD